MCTISFVGTDYLPFLDVGFTGLLSGTLDGTSQAINLPTELPLKFGNSIQTKAYVSKTKHVHVCDTLLIQ